MQRRGPVDQRDLAVGQAQAAGQAGGERADALGVLVRVVVAVAGGLQDALQELLLGRFGVRRRVSDWAASAASSSCWRA